MPLSIELGFIVLYELHGDSGRQGADVALMVRRVREALAERLQYTGTLATMAKEGTKYEKNRKVRASGGAGVKTKCHSWLGIKNTFSEILNFLIHV